MFDTIMIKNVRPKHPDKNMSSTNPGWTFTGRLMVSNAPFCAELPDFDRQG